MPKSTKKQNPIDPEKLGTAHRKYYENRAKEFKYFNPKPNKRPTADAMFHAIELASTSFGEYSDESARLMCRAILLMDLAHQLSTGNGLFKLVSSQLDAMERNILKAGAR